MLNPDFAIILNFKLADPELTPSTADALVKRARDIGARCIASNSPAAFEAACEVVLEKANQRASRD